MDPAETLVVADELARERVLIDALPYLDNEYEDPTVQAEVGSQQRWRPPRLSNSRQHRSSLLLNPRTPR